MSSESLKVLYVDDEQDILDIAKMSMEKVGGMKAICTPDPLRASELIKEHKPDLILLDMMMPKIDGIELFKVLKSQGLVGAIPVVFVTARVQGKDVDEYIQVGAIGVITKPFDPMKLPSEIKALHDASIERLGEIEPNDLSLKLVTKSYVESLKDRILVLEHCKRDLERSGNSATNSSELKSCVHKLAGSGTTFGFPEISNIASDLEKVISEDQSDELEKQLALIEQLITACEQACNV